MTLCVELLVCKNKSLDCFMLTLMLVDFHSNTLAQTHIPKLLFIVKFKVTLLDCFVSIVSQVCVQGKKMSRNRAFFFKTNKKGNVTF